MALMNYLRHISPRFVHQFRGSVFSVTIYIFKDPVVSNSHSHLAMVVLREEVFDMSCASGNVNISGSDEGCEMEKKRL